MALRLALDPPYLLFVLFLFLFSFLLFLFLEGLRVMARRATSLGPQPSLLVLFFLFVLCFFLVCCVF